jgi:hypothetical protein
MILMLQNLVFTLIQILTGKHAHEKRVGSHVSVKLALLKLTWQTNVSGKEIYSSSSGGFAAL